MANRKRIVLEPVFNMELADWRGLTLIHNEAVTTRTTSSALGAGEAVNRRQDRQGDGSNIEYRFLVKTPHAPGRFYFMFNLRCRRNLNCHFEASQ